MLFDHCDDDDADDGGCGDRIDHGDECASADVDDGDFAKLNGVQPLAGNTTTCNGYEIPIRDCDVQVIDERNGSRISCINTGADDAGSDGLSRTSSTLSGDRMQERMSAGEAPVQSMASLTMSQRRRQRAAGHKERTFSSSSTVSEHTVFPDGGGGGCVARLHVALPLDECSSRETLLMAQTTTTPTPNGLVDDRPLPQSRRSLRQQNSLKRHGGTAPHRIGLDCAEAKTIM